MDHLVDDVVRIIYDFAQDDIFGGISAIALRLTTRRFAQLLYCRGAHLMANVYECSRTHNNIYGGAYLGTISAGFARGCVNVLKSINSYRWSALKYAVNNSYQIDIFPRLFAIFGDRYMATCDEFIEACQTLQHAGYSKSKFKKYMRDTFMYTIRYHARSVYAIKSVLSCSTRYKRELNGLMGEYDKTWFACK